MGPGGHVSTTGWPTEILPLLGALFEHASGGVLLADAEGSVLHANPAACRRLGRSGSELAALRIPGLLADTRALGEWSTLFAPDGGQGRIRLRAADGNVVAAEASAAVVPGGPILACLLLRNERPSGSGRRAAFDAAIAALPIGIVVIEVGLGGTPRILASNAAYQRIVGEHPPAGTPLAKFGHRVFAPDRVTPVPPAEWPGPRAAISGATVLDTELHLRWPDGSWRVLSTSAHPIPPQSSGAPRRAVGVLLDVTDRHEADAGAREARSTLEAALSSMTDAVCVSDRDGNVVRYNDAFVNFHRLRSRDEFARPVAGYADFLELFLPDGTPAPVERWPIPRALRGETAVGVEYELRRRDTGERWIASYSFSPIRRDGRIAGAVVVGRDVTEDRARDARLQVAGRLAALGTLVAGVGHEINNPLTSVTAGIAFLQEDIQAARSALQAGRPPAPEALDQLWREELDVLRDALDGATRIARIVKDLAVLGAPEGGRRRERLADVVAAALRWLPASVSANASVTVEDGGAPDVYVSRGQLEQVIVNLVTNAARATRPGERGAIVLRLRAGSPGMSRLQVVDHGVGMDRATLAQIFDPFFTTRPAGDRRGTGLGLAICHAIVTAHGGAITARSEPGLGSTFSVELPGTTLPAGAP